MEYTDFLSKLINQGIEAVKRDYGYPLQRAKHDGSLQAFEACRDKNPYELREIYTEVKQYLKDFYKGLVDYDENYWWFRCYEAEIEYVINAVSGYIFITTGEKPQILPGFPTTMGTLCAHRILSGTR